MRRRWLGAVGGVVALALALAAPAHGAGAAPGASLSAQNVLVVVRSGTSPEAVASGLGVRPYRVLNGLVSGFAARLDERARAQLVGNSAVVMTARDRVFHADSASMPPPAVASAEAGTYPPVTSYRSFVTGNVRRVGVPARAATTRVHVPIGIAVIDSGVQVDNPDLNVVGGVNCSDDPGLSYSDNFGHGTEVAGVLAAKDNAFGTVGVAPGAPLYSIKVLDHDDSAEDSNLICGLNWVAAHHRGIALANMSLDESVKGPADDHNCGLSNDDAVHYAVCEAAHAGVVLVAGAGNDHRNVKHFIPAGYSQVVTVSGLSDTDGRPGGLGRRCDGNRDDVFAQFSNYGRSVAIAAVATCIQTDYNDGTLIYDDGTSFAAPEVTGAIALLDYLIGSRVTTAQARLYLILTAERDNSLRGDPVTPHEGVLNVQPLWRALIGGHGAPNWQVLVAGSRSPSA